jgi:hypothetical protein
MPSTRSRRGHPLPNTESSNSRKRAASSDRADAVAVSLPPSTPTDKFSGGAKKARLLEQPDEVTSGLVEPVTEMDIDITTPTPSKKGSAATRASAMKAPVVTLAARGKGGRKPRGKVVDKDDSDIVKSDLVIDNTGSEGPVADATHAGGIGNESPKAKVEASIQQKENSEVVDQGPVKTDVDAEGIQDAVITSTPKKGCTKVAAKVANVILPAERRSTRSRAPPKDTYVETLAAEEEAKKAPKPKESTTPKGRSGRKKKLTVTETWAPENITATTSPFAIADLSVTSPS